ncbi:Quinidine resistance protein 1 [Trichoderma ghanense]|uniref:Quinidine resistance protein 1 n=1 Tax=Trichoderma ghanense TaxID=65468 RepID=A0ABY2H6W7_9HYPO
MKQDGAIQRVDKETCESPLPVEIEPDIETTGEHYLHRNPEAKLADQDTAELPASYDQGEAIVENLELGNRHAINEPYSIFSRRMKIWITIMATIASVVSPMTAHIYFPALDALAEELNVSISLLNLTLTSYMIFQGISPTIFGDFGDMAGRRPAFIVAFIIYICANIGLALQRNYAALLVLRCLQSAGSSGTLALSYAVVADITPTAKRGKYMGLVSVGINIGPTIGPVIGGLLTQYLQWPSIFWFCAIFVAVWLVPWVVTVPEMCRNVVGNGSIPPQSWNVTVIEFFKRRKRGEKPQHGPKRKLRFPNPLGTLVITFDKQMSQILLIAAIIYCNFILVAATLSPLFTEIYHYNELEVGLCFLPYGLGCCLTVVLQGYVVDWNYRRIAKKLGVDASHGRRNEIGDFPIESARIQPIYPSLLAGAAAVTGYGWALQAETSVAAPLVLVFAIGMLVPSTFSILNTLIVDLYPGSPATAAAANNLVRCLFGAAATAVVDHMIDAMGRGWCFTFLALLMVACLPWLRFIEKRGPRWRAEKLKRKNSTDSERAEPGTTERE